MEAAGFEPAHVYGHYVTAAILRPYAPLAFAFFHGAIGSRSIHGVPFLSATLPKDAVGEGVLCPALDRRCDALGVRPFTGPIGFLRWPHYGDHPAPRLAA